MEPWGELCYVCVGVGLSAFRDKESCRRSYFRLAETFHTQEEPSYCGLASLAMVLNALLIDPGRVWKGVWRWYAEGLLECCEPLAVVQKSGVTLEKLACTARCNYVEAETIFGADEDTLRAMAQRVCSQPPEAPEEFVIAAYSRRELGQTGDGHFSPIAGYHAPSDRVLVLDVARFKYPPQWLPVADLSRAMQPIDAASGKPRGLLAIRKDPYRRINPVFRLEFLDHATFIRDRRPPNPLADAIKHLPTPTTSIPIEWAAGVLDSLVLAGALPRIRVRDTAYCCQSKSATARTLLLQVAAQCHLDRMSLQAVTPEEAAATLMAIPSHFWPRLPQVDKDCVAALQTALANVLPASLAEDVNDQRINLMAYLDFALDDDVASPTRSHNQDSKKHITE